LRLLDDSYSGHEEVASWVRGLLLERHSPFVRAEAVLALASSNQIQFHEVQYLLTTEPNALSSWYLVAIRRLRAHVAVEDKEYRSAQMNDGVATALLHE
jgi:hypothetical protein